MEPRTAHPDQAELEALRTGEAGDGVAEHLASCEPCQRLLSGLDDLHARLGEPDALVAVELGDRLKAQLSREAARVRRARRRPRLALVAAAAAALLLVVTSTVVRQQAPAPAAEVASVVSPRVAGDLTRDGRLDVLDAFALARALESDVAPPDDWDFNGDGRIDHDDVDSLARAAVSLERSS